MFFFNRLYEAEVDKSGMLNIRLGVGIGLFQGCANIFLNGDYSFLSIVIQYFI